MRFTQLATLLSLGAGSLSILIPPSTSLENSKIEFEISDKTDKTDAGKLTAEEYAITQLTQTLNVPCESCPFYNGKGRDTGAAVYSNTPNDLVLTISLDPKARDTISLNGAPLFPFIYTQSAPEPFTVTQKDKETGEEAQVPIGLDLFIETDSTGLSRLRLHVLSVSGFQTQATMEILEFPVFQNDFGDIFIGEVHVRPPTPSEASAVMCKGDMFCRWKAYVYDVVAKITGTGAHRGPRKGCHGKKYKRPPHSVAHEQSYDAKHHGKHHGEHHEHKHGWKVLSLGGIIVRLIIACLVVAAITMCIGLFVTIFISSIIHVALVAWWFITGKYKNLNIRNYQPVVDEEEQGLMSKEEESHMDAAPEYTDDLPVYAESDQH